MAGSARSSAVDGVGVAEAGAQQQRGDAGQEVVVAAAAVRPQLRLEADVLGDQERSRPALVERARTAAARWRSVGIPRPP